MPQRLPRAKRMALFLAGTAGLVLGFCLSAGSGMAHAVPLLSAGPGGHASLVEPVRIYSFYFGFVPYAPGDIENQALKRQFYPQDIEWPPGLYGGPRPGLGPKRWD